MAKKIGIFALLLLFAVPAQAAGIRHFMTATVGVFDAGTAEFEYRLSPSSYGVNSTVRTNGTFAALYPFEAKYATAGKIAEGKLLADTYRYRSQSRFSQRSKQTFYDDSGRPLYSISSKNGKSKRRPIVVPQGEFAAIDLQTVLALVIRQYKELRFCAGRLPVFDGKRRYDVILEDEGRAEIPAGKHSAFSGSAAKCSMYIDKLQEKGDDLLWEMTSDRPIYFWIAQDDKNQYPFIAHIKIDETPLGEMNVYTTKIEVEEE